MRVLMVTPNFFPLMGGVETHVYEVGRRMVQQGIAVTVLTTDRAGTLSPTETLEGIEIRRVPDFPAHQDWHFAPAMRDVIASQTWDLVHCQGCHTFTAPLAMQAARRNGIPYIVTFHTGGHSSSLRNIIRGMQWRVQRPLFAQARRLIGVSQFEARAFQNTLQLPAERFTVIPNGGQLTIPDGAYVPSADPLILSVGRLERYKGHHRVLAAMPEVLRQRPTARLEILGGGPYEVTLQQTIKQMGLTDHVTMRTIPSGDRAAMAAKLSSAHLVMLLSEYEAHPVAVMEALALHRPVMVSDTSGLRELADRGWVRAIPLNSTPAATGQAIVAALENPLIPTDVQLPNWDDCTSALVAVYHEALGVTACAS